MEPKISQTSEFLARVTKVALTLSPETIFLPAEAEAGEEDEPPLFLLRDCFKSATEFGVEAFELALVLELDTAYEVDDPFERIYAESTRRRAKKANLTSLAFERAIVTCCVERGADAKGQKRGESVGAVTERT